MSNPERPFGWRKRIGLLSPTVIETAAYDFYRLAPDGVSMCATTSNIDHWSQREFQAARARPDRDRSQLSRVAPRRLHHPHRHAGRDHARQGLRGRARQADRGRDRTARHHQHPLGDPRARASRRPQRRRGVALSARNCTSQRSPSSARAASTSSPTTPMDVVFKQLQDVTPAQIAATAKRVLGSAPAADGVYIPCNQWSAADAAPLIESATRRAGGDRRACRLLGGVSLSRHS